MVSELKPCPFCGGTDLSSGGDDKFVGYSCKTCQATGPNHYGSRDWNTRPTPVAPVSPDATGKCGELETVAQAHFDEFGEFDDIAWIKGYHPHPECIQLVTRSQAEELLAAERAAIPILKGTAFKSGDGWKDTTKEGEVCFVWNKMLPAPYASGQYSRVGKEHWRASTENFTFEPATPDEVVELFSEQKDETYRWHQKAMDAGVISHSDGTTSHPMRKERDDLKADNAALTARVKETEDCYLRLCEAIGVAATNAAPIDASEKLQALEAKLAAAEKALKTARPYVEDYDTRRHNTGVDETLTQIDAVLGGKPS